jgi:DNA-binding NtrC family response regulator
VFETSLGEQAVQRHDTCGFFNMTAIISPPLRVLIVDDEALIRWSLSERLSSEGYEVHEAGDGAAMRALFQSDPQRFHLVLLDLKLPDTDGLSLLADIRRLCPTCRVIMMTAFGTSETLTQARAQGAYDIVSKPFDLERLLGLVKEALA